VGSSGYTGYGIICILLCRGAHDTVDPNVLCNSSAVVEVGDAYNIQVVPHKQDEVARSKVVVAHDKVR
jgi:hypothetical protein